MAEVKSHEFDAFLKRKPLPVRLFLIYGPDRGLVSERAAAIAAASGVDLDDAFSVVKLDAGEIGSQPGRLMDEMNAIGLFGGERLVWVRNAAGEKGVADAIDMLASASPGPSTLIVEAGDLKKGSALRKAAEAASQAVAIPCYADDGRALQALIDQELAAEGLRIAPAARQRLVETIGGDRLASRNELRKLTLYCRGRDLIEEQDVEDIVGDASAISTDDAIDAILKGDKDGFLHAIQKIVTSKTPIFLVLQGCLRQFQLLELMRAEMDEKRAPAAQAMATLGRHLHFRRKPIVENALKTWASPAIRRETQRLQAAILQSRQRPALEDTIAMQTLLATVLQSARR
ncbi:DNA polymerase III subunit delta [Shinella sumterensis]|uniref:DNA polymerase III subunit delta n=1 Tax=Shinella sumterensis TaxID=1967501 RepID=UPI00106DF5E0|nr:DNA polymerase III subunit delta [Shinella sumterensis]MCD1264442.1 DNA polymerase III subunit delta [Shinella sumterensis]TFE99044.1 DNA polymerase III subunit delta [Shinella sumterensis]